MSRVAFVTLVLVIIASSVAAADLSVTLAVEPTTTMFGIPPTLRFSVKNASAKPMNLPRFMVLIATPENGQPFIVRRDQFSSTAAVQFDWIDPLYDVEDPWGEERYIEVPAGRTLVIEMAPQPGFSELGWFAEHEVAGLKRPGRYRLKLLFNDIMSEYTLLAIASRPLNEVPGLTVVSTEAELTIREPQGADAAACAAMREVTGEKNNRCPAAMMLTRSPADVDAFLQKHGGSTIARAVSGMRLGVRRVDRVTQLERAVRDGLPIFTDWYRLQLALEEEQAYHELRRDDILRARRYLYQSHAHLAELVEQAKVIEVRRKAERNLEGISDFISQRMIALEAEQP